MKNNIFASLVLGSLFLCCGVTWLIANFAGWNINFSLLWPLFLLIPGGITLSNYLVNRKEIEMLIAGITLILLSATFLLNNLLFQATGSSLIWTITIFMYPGSAAIAFWIAWTVKGEFKLAVTAIILSAVSLFLLCFFSFVAIVDRFFAATGAGRLIWPLALICVGVIILLISVVVASVKDRTRKFEKQVAQFGKNLEEKLNPSEPRKLSEPAPVAQEAEIVQEKKSEPENINNNY